MPVKKTREALEFTVPILLTALHHHGAGHVAHDDLIRIKGRGPQHAHRMIMGQHHVGDRLVRHFPDPPDEVLPVAGELGIDQDDARLVMEAAQETYDLLEDEIHRLVRLVEDLQQLTKAQAAKAYLQRERINLPELVSQALELHRHQFESRQIAIEARFDTDLQDIEGDRDKLLQVLRNLIQNAWEHTPRGERVTVTADSGDGAVTLSFANSGVEVNREDLPHIFERFYRAEKSRSRESGGAGIGLSIVKELIEAHGGQVGASSSAGETRFWVTLPA